MRKEIEVKAKASDGDVLIRNLVALGCKMSDPIVQEDRIYRNFTGDFSKFSPGKNFLRIRKAKGKILFTLKQSVTNILDKIEKEIEVSDAEELDDILKLMGYREEVQVHKTRKKTDYNGLEICVDEVRGLGSFIEVEKITEDGDAAQVQKELFEFLQTLGVKKEDQIFLGYDQLIWLKNNPK